MPDVVAATAAYCSALYAITPFLFSFQFLFIAFFFVVVFFFAFNSFRFVFISFHFFAIVLLVKCHHRMGHEVVFTISPMGFNGLSYLPANSIVVLSFVIKMLNPFTWYIRKECENKNSNGNSKPQQINGNEKIKKYTESMVNHKLTIFLADETRFTFN